MKRGPHLPVLVALRRPRPAVALALAAAALALLALVALSERQVAALAAGERARLQAQLVAAEARALAATTERAATLLPALHGTAAPQDPDSVAAARDTLRALVGDSVVFVLQGPDIAADASVTAEGPGAVPAIPAASLRIAARDGGAVTLPDTDPEGGMLMRAETVPGWDWTIAVATPLAPVRARAQGADIAGPLRAALLGGRIAGALAVLAVLGVCGSIVLWQRRASTARLRALTQRVFDAQERERGRVARELHDGISQSLVGVRYAIDVTRRRLAVGDARAPETLEKAAEGLGAAIQEVRRISRDLRPGMLDDLGLGAAIRALAEDFRLRTGIETRFEPTVFRNRLDQEAKIALYRIAQEALTNVERHAGARCVTIDLRGHRTGATLRIADDGTGLPVRTGRAHDGIGLRNMQERMDQIGGTLRILSSRGGTVIEARVPLTHLLPPEQDPGPPPRSAKA